MPRTVATGLAMELADVLGIAATRLQIVAVTPSAGAATTVDMTLDLLAARDDDLYTTLDVSAALATARRSRRAHALTPSGPVQPVVERLRRLVASNDPALQRCGGLCTRALSGSLDAPPPRALAAAPSPKRSRDRPPFRKRALRGAGAWAGR
jgi:hypothetical protein